jgi:hypothetical protein
MQHCVGIFFIVLQHIKKKFLFCFSVDCYVMLFAYIMEKLQQQLMVGLQMIFPHECFKTTLQHNDFLEYKDGNWFMWVVY